jgi:hypothetical protein
MLTDGVCPAGPKAMQQRCTRDTGHWDHQGVLAGVSASPPEAFHRMEIGWYLNHSPAPNAVSKGR